MTCKNCEHDADDHASEAVVAGGGSPCTAGVTSADDDLGGGMQTVSRCPCKGWEAA